MQTTRLLFLLLLSVVSSVAARCETLSPAERDFFETKIRPVLVEHCYSCHNSSDTAEGGLVLDFRGGVLDGGDGGPIVVKGNPSTSRLIPILKHEVAGMEMPEGGPKLDAETIKDFERWIAMGLPDPRETAPSEDQLAAETSWQQKLERRKQWWSFRPIAPVDVPPEGVSGPHPIDRFIDRRLEQQGLRPSPPADSATLIRRLHFTLLGLPPSTTLVESWTTKIDAASDPKRVIEELIDELLGNPHFGERFARHWMDWIRYAESHGSEGDPAIDNAWLYRDYLIRALNQDIPYDQLVREHLAGDLLETPRINEALGINESTLATAHLRMVFHGFAPTDALDEKVRFIDDQINVLSKAFMGITVSCARCHDHKFDAISQADYYALFGILASCRPGRNVIDVESIQTKNLEELDTLKSQIREGMSAAWLDDSSAAAERLVNLRLNDKPAGDLARLMTQLRTRLENGDAAKDTDFRSAWQHLLSTESERLAAWQSFTRDAGPLHWNLASQQDADQWHVHGMGARHSPAGEFAIAAESAQVLTGIYPGGVYTHALSNKHPGRLTSPDFNLDSKSKLWVQSIGQNGASVRYVVQDYPRSGTVYPVSKLADAWKFQQYDLTYWSGDRLHVELATAMDAPLLTSNTPRSWFGVRRAFVIPKDTAPPINANECYQPLIDASKTGNTSNLAELTRVVEQAIRNSVTAWTHSTATDSQALFLDACLREGVLANSMQTLGDLRPLVKRYRDLEQQIATPRRVPGLEETLGEDQPLMVRGNHKNLSDPVPRRFLEAIDDAPYDTPQSGRLQYAHDLLREDNPLTRRVIVNRIWHHLFGRGIVSTPDNLGRLGDAPSHPELLDWLANDFPKHGWSIKRLVRQIVTSAAWQRSVLPVDGAAERDPENIFLSHAHVRRLEAEAIRDAMLSVSGRLDDTLFGAPVAASSNRRSVYMRVIRNRLDPFLRAFDFPEPFSTTGRRDATNVPAQSLAMMNDTQIARYADAWGQSLLRDETLQGDSERITKLFLQAFARRPSAEELQLASNYVADALESSRKQRQFQTSLQRQIVDFEQRINETLERARKRVSEGQLGTTTKAAASVPPPIASWDFTTGTEDVIGDCDAQLEGNCRLTPQGLVVRDGGYAVSKPLSRQLTEKTLEVWVQLDNLEQRGGGAVSLQTPDGRTFDAIVYGERDPGQWLAGSNNFARTQPFGGSREDEADRSIVQITITYDRDGTITGFRNGVPYGQAYKSGAPHVFQPGTVVSFGVRHLPAVGNRLLSGTIVAAKVYPTALSLSQVAATTELGGYVITEAQLLASLDPSDRKQLQRDRETLARLKQQHSELPSLNPDDTQQAWSELARAIFLFKEFIYVR